MGDKLTLSTDDNNLAVLAPMEHSLALGFNGDQENISPRGNSNNGAIYLFVGSSEAWRQQAYINPPNNNTTFAFKLLPSIALDGTGDSLTSDRGHKYSLSLLLPLFGYSCNANLS